MAADIIVNDWGFTDYQLDIYGDMERAPTYSVECQEIIASKGLRDNVALKGLGNPMKVLEECVRFTYLSPIFGRLTHIRQWVFLNSSVSEGLPLAMGEAALMGVPIICTDVGASFRVVVDAKTNTRISKLVAPNDAMSLARAQIGVLGLLDEWAKHAGDPEGYSPTLPLRPTPEDVKKIQKRIYEKQEQRRAFGMMSRDNILNSFSGDRYLREHEQMLWIGKHQSNSYRATLRDYSSNSSWTDEEWGKPYV
jgi:glycosyltransferase involved in cell wall biosynthesis